MLGIHITLNLHYHTYFNGKIASMHGEIGEVLNAYENLVKACCTNDVEVKSRGIGVTTLNDKTKITWGQCTNPKCVKFPKKKESND
jgi:hypothetical protein